MRCRNSRVSATSPSGLATATLSGLVAAVASVVLLVSATVTAQDRFPAAGGDILLTPLIHSSVQIEHAGRVIQIDPWSVGDLSRMKPADLIVITDDVGHHLDVKAIQSLRKPGAPAVIAANGKSRVPDGIVLANGESTTITHGPFAKAPVRIDAIAAYDIKPGDPYHPKGEANGYIITVGDRRIYFAGVTECVPEIRALKGIEVAFFPMNVPLERMEPSAAVECIRSFKPKIVYPYHYDQDWVARVQKGAPRPDPSTRGLEELRAGLKADGIEVRFANWYPR
jgi:L-ascorbate metabolism protein UlaG (beta-lactamase superfamily)